ncbi:hypothetical protein M9434_003082 [Picochlorum sp. BPE23]|nr:hypothetical protein M9434_003082 [Picochlorum sp. BPE23]
MTTILEERSQGLSQPAGPAQRHGSPTRGSNKQHRRGHLLKDQLELVKIKSSDGSSRYSIKPLPSEVPFDKGLFVFVRAVQLLTSKNKDTIVVGLAGPSGSGKTAFAKKIRNLVPGCTLLSMDNYNDGSKVIDGNFDDPRITDYDTLMHNLAELKEGKSTKVPVYDFKQSCRVGYETVDVPESRVVILEGIYALSHRISPLLDLKVSITGGVHFDLVKRVLRDIDRSGQAPEEIIQQVSDTVYPMYKAFIEPDLKTAHLRIYNPFNPFSGFMSPTYILKSRKQLDIESLRESLGLEESKKQETETYDIYLVPPGEDAETCQSWLRMRNRDGRYNLMFEEWVVEDKFIISPRVTFEVPVRILGGLMALGYEIGTIMQRTSESYFTNDGKIMVKVDHILGVDRHFVQIQGKDRNKVAEMGTALGLDGTYYPHSYIEIIQLENLTQEFLTVSEDLKRRFAVNGEPLTDELVGSLSKGSSPLISGSSFLGGSYTKTTGFHVSSPPMNLVSSSAPIRATKPISAASHGSSRQGLLTQKMTGVSGISLDSGGGGNHSTPDKNIHIENGVHHRRSPSTQGSGGSSAGTTRPNSPHSVDVQLKKLLQSQAVLTSQIEDLTMQLRMVQGTDITKDDGDERRLSATTAAAVGVTCGLLLSLFFLRK